MSFFLECSKHPGHKLLAYQQTAFATPCTIEIDGMDIEIEMDDRTEFVRDMETSTIVCYLCSVDGCTWSVSPERLPGFAADQLRSTARPTVVEADEITGENVEGYDPYDEADAIEILSGSISGPHPTRVHADEVELMEDETWKKALEPWGECVQEEGESNEDFHLRKSSWSVKKMQERRAAIDAHTPGEGAMAKVRRALGASD